MDIDRSEGSKHRPSKVGGLTLALKGGESSSPSIEHPQVFAMSGPATAFEVDSRVLEEPSSARGDAFGSAQPMEEPSREPPSSNTNSLVQSDVARAEGVATTTGKDTSDTAVVLNEFEAWQREHPDSAVAVAAIHALTAVIRHSQASTMMGLEVELRDACTVLKREHSQLVSIHAACDLFLCFVTRSLSAEHREDLAKAKAHLIERGARFSDISLKARETIALLGQEFLCNGTVVLTHGFSRVVLAVFKAAASRGKGFRVVITEGGDTSGQRMADELGAMGVPVTRVKDCSMGRALSGCDLVIVGADGVAESGGIVNHVGTFQVAVVARALGKPLYVAAESYKFARMFPLTPADWAGEEPVTLQGNTKFGFQGSGSGLLTWQHFSHDYTPPHLLTLLFTDLGVLTPSAVSDELIQLYL